MVCNFGFVSVLFPFELQTLVFGMTLRLAEYGKRSLSLIIAIQEFVGVISSLRKTPSMSPLAIGIKGRGT